MSGGNAVITDGKTVRSIADDIRSGKLYMAKISDHGYITIMPIYLRYIGETFANEAIVVSHGTEEYQIVDP